MLKMSKMSHEILPHNLIKGLIKTMKTQKKDHIRTYIRILVKLLPEKMY